MNDGELTFVERSAAGDAEALLILHHGRGSDELDLIGLADVLDPDRRLQVISVRAPLTLPGQPGYHWYKVPRVGYPDHDSFHAAYRALAAFHDDQMTRLGVSPARTVLAGFSMGAVMSYALGLGPERPVPAGIMALSGFVPTVDGWAPAFDGRARLPVLIAHGRRDPVIDVEFAHTARNLLDQAGLDVEYHESDAAHHIDPALVPALIAWLARAAAPRPQREELR